MNPFYLLVVFIGFTVVAQGNMNRAIANLWGLPTATLLSAVSFLALSLVWFFIARLYPNTMPDFLRVRTQGDSISWWYILPGMLGVAFVAGMPWAFQNIGATKTFILLVASQIVFGIVWDLLITQITISTTTLIGAGITLVGAAVTVWN